MENKRTLLLTGVTGFLGSHLLKKLILLGEYNIICIKRSFSSLERIEKLNLKKLKFYNSDTIDLEKIFLENQIDGIIHMATEYGRIDKSIYKVLETNLMFPIKIAELAIKYRVKFFINTDSYFNKDTFSYDYLLNYSLSKKSLLSWLKRLSKEIQVVNMVLEHLYGENDDKSKFVEFIIQSVAIENKKEIDLTHGHQRRDFVYIDDVVDAYIKVIDYSLKNQFLFKTFDVGTGVVTEIREFVETVKSISNSKTQLNFGKIPYRSDEIMESKADNVDLKNLGWEARYTLDEGIKRIIEKY